jgi:cystathionine beta-lyase
MSAFWKGTLADLRFEVEHRSSPDDGGPSLRVLRRGDGRELLRFDCFDRGPHYHVDPAGRDDLVQLDPLADNVAWTAGELSRDLAGYLEKAGARSQGWSQAELDRLLRDAQSAMRNPPLELEDLSLPLLRSRLSEKWETYPGDEVLPAWVAEMDYPLAEPVRRVLQRAVDRWDVGYPIAPERTGLREAFAERMAARFGWQVAPDDVAILSDVVQGIYWALPAYSAPGEGAVVQTPIYPPFLQAVAECGRRLEENRLLPGPEGYEIDFDGLRRADARVLLLCHPHNPTGRVFRDRELEAIAEIALARDWVVVSDEIHADLVYGGRRFRPFASLSPEVAARTVTLTSATKAFNIAGLRCAVAHFGSPELRARFRAAFPRHVGGGIGILGLYATIAAWRHAQPWLDQVLAALEGNRRFLAQVLGERFPEVVFHAPEATYLSWLDCRALDLPRSPAHFFYRRAGVALSDGRHFGSGFEGFARLNFATSRAILAQVLERMASALADHQSGRS